MLSSMQTIRRSLLIVGVLGLTIACSLPLGMGGGGAEGAPFATITSPSDGGRTVVGQEVTVRISAGDASGPGVQRVELSVGGAVVNSCEVDGGPQAAFDTQLTWTPQTEGPATLEVVAYRPDGTPSPAATITLDVQAASAVEETPAETATTEVETAEPTAEAPPVEDTPAEAPTAGTPGGETATLRVTVNLNVRCEPDEDAPTIGALPVGQEVEASAATDPAITEEVWYRIPIHESYGWIWGGGVAALDDTSGLPIMMESYQCELAVGYCGDGVCEDGEWCWEDCSAFKDWEWDWDWGD
jgi:hypothetical protein